jgi:hypothetical protein
MRSNTYLCSFASPDLFLTRFRFYIQAKRLNFYQNIKIYSFKELSLNSKIIIKKYISKNDRTGYGYWCWKPEIVLRSLINIPDNAILHYCDIGCTFSKNDSESIKLLYNYEKICNLKNSISFQFCQPNYKIDGLIYETLPEYKFTKHDLANYFNLSINSNHMKSPQICATSFFIKKNKKNIEFLKKWLKTFDNMKLIDNTASILNNHKEFISHRNDQSSFSILSKINNNFTMSVYDHFEYALMNNKPYWAHLEKSPMVHKRDLRFFSFYKIQKKIREFSKSFLNYF